MSTYTPYTEYKTTSFNVTSGSGTIVALQRKSMVVLEITGFATPGSPFGSILCTGASSQVIYSIAAGQIQGTCVGQSGDTVDYSSLGNLSTFTGIVHLFEID